MRGVEIDPPARRARVEAGMLADELAVAAGEHGLAYLAGTSPDVGVVGYMLGGGISWLVRSTGWPPTASPRSSVVTADGRLVRTDAENEPDLFWAVRGGGGNFAAVTALECELFPSCRRSTPAASSGRSSARPRSSAPGGLGRHRARGVQLARPAAQAARLPFIPDHLQGARLRDGRAAFIGSEADGQRSCSPSATSSPSSTQSRMIPTAQLSTVNMDPAEPVPYYGEGIHLRDVRPATIDKLVEVIVDSPLMHAEVRHLGGAAARSAAGYGALDRIDVPVHHAHVRARARRRDEGGHGPRAVRLHSTLAPWDSGRRYLNFAESPMDVETIYPPESYRRLCELKARYDPGHLFRANHPLPTEGGG